MACSSIASICCFCASGAALSISCARASIRPAVRKAIDSADVDLGGDVADLLADRDRTRRSACRTACARCAYLTPSSRQYLAPPIAPTPSFQRPMLRMLKAILWPCPIVPSTFSAGTAQSSRMSGQVELPRMPSLCSSGPTVRPGALRSTRKRGELLAVDLGEHGEQIGEAGVGDELLGAGEAIGLAVGGEHRLGLGGQRVRARARLGERVGGDQLAGGQRGRYCCCCSGVPNSTSGMVPMPTCAP